MNHYTVAKVQKPRWLVEIHRISLRLGWAICEIEGCTFEATFVPKSWWVRGFDTLLANALAKFMLK